MGIKKYTLVCIEIGPLWTFDFNYIFLETIRRIQKNKCCLKDKLMFFDMSLNLLNLLQVLGIKLVKLRHDTN